MLNAVHPYLLRERLLNVILLCICGSDLSKLPIVLREKVLDLINVSVDPKELIFYNFYTSSFNLGRSPSMMERQTLFLNLRIIREWLPPFYSSLIVQLAVVSYFESLSNEVPDAAEIKLGSLIS